MRSFIVSVLFFGGFFNLNAQGRIVVPHHPAPWNGQVSLQAIDASVTLRQGVGTVTLEQRFYNHAEVTLEGEYHFSLPADAHMQDFNLHINGKKTRGELVEAGKARRIYEDIVRKSRDPALLEFADHGLFRARIFPIAAKKDRTIELTYTQLLTYESGTYRFVLPIRQSGQGSIEQVHLRLDLEAEADLGNIYSPSHKIEVSRDGSRKARVSLEVDQMQANQDFILYYGLANPDVDFTLLTYRPRTDRDGYFMLLANPNFPAVEPKIGARDFIFLIDQSGSMNGEKLQQAREALNFCITTLNPRDRFEIVGFSSTVSGFQDHLREADRETVENARAFIRSLDASGGTNIDAALSRALALKTEDDRRPTSIIFLTDGLPTEGETDVRAILGNVADQKRDFIRIFSFGVGYDVNTYLLDRLSEDSHGATNYVRPGESIESEISRFFAKISSPALSNPEIQFGRSRAYDYYPRKLPDLFSGHRAMIVGRYRSPGDGVIRLSGIQGQEKREFEIEGTFARRESTHGFIARLWANRKVVALLNQIRFNGEEDELVQSIRELGEEFGIVTPYTSYLVTEQEQELVDARPRPGGRPLRPDIRRLQAISQSRASQSGDNDEAIGSQTYLTTLKSPALEPSASSGRRAVATSRILKKLVSAEQGIDMMLTVRRIGERSFHLKSGIWVETGIAPGAGAQIIAFLSDEYFALSREHDELRRILALGEEVRFRWKNLIYEIRSSVN